MTSAKRQSNRPTPSERREARAAIDDPGVVMESAAAFLAVRPRSIEETRRRLRHRGYTAPLVEHVVARLIEMGYLDDEDFARRWVESRDRARPRGTVALRRELALKGVAREVVDDVLAERSMSTHLTMGDSPDRSAATALLARRRTALEREPDERRRRQKAYALLARHGFDPETCKTVAAAFVGQRDATEIS